MIAYHATEHAAIAAALVGIGVPASMSDRLARAFPGGRGLASASPATIAAAAGCQAIRVPAWARRIPAAFRLASAAASHAADDRTQCNSPHDVVRHLRSVLGLSDVERFAVVMLDARQQVIDTVIVAQGSVSQVDVHPREVFRPAVQCNAHTVIVGHNHPSGNADPSAADIELTDRLCSVGRMVGIPVLDHIVIGNLSSVSFAQRGLLSQ